MFPYDWQLRKLIRCKASEARKLLAVVDWFIEMNKKARSTGLLSLEDEIATVTDQFSRTGFELVLDGTDPDLVRGILSQRILVGGSTGAELVRELIIFEGVLSLQRGDSLRRMHQRLTAVLGSLHNRGEVPEPPPKQTQGETSTEVQNEFEPVSEATALIEDIAQFQDLSIAMLLEHLDNRILAKALCGAGSAVRKAFLRNMSERSGRLLLADIEFEKVTGPPSKSEVAAAQQEVRELVERLQKEGKTAEK